jgi:hypothetical protein
MHQAAFRQCERFYLGESIPYDTHGLPLDTRGGSSGTFRLRLALSMIFPIRGDRVIDDDSSVR